MERVILKTPAESEQLFATLCRDTAAVSPEAYLARWQNLFQKYATTGLPQELLQAMARLSGMDENGLAEGIRLILQGLSRGHPDYGQVSVPCRRRVAIISAGNIPGVAVAPAITLAAAGCPVLVKLSRAEPYFFPWLLDAWHGEYSVEPGIRAHPWPAEGTDLRAILESAQTVLVFGSDPTVAALRETYRRKQVLGFGHKFSIGWVANADREALHKLARDVALFRQQGCLSVQVVFVHGDRGTAEQAAESFAPVLADVLLTCGGAGPALRYRQLLDEVDLLGVPRYGGEKADGCVLLPSQFTPEYLRGDGVVQFLPAAGISEALAALGPLRQALQGVSVASSVEEFTRWRELWLAAGVNYVQPAGEMQAPPLDWANGGIVLPAAVCGY